jgi:hypothetical protein
VKVIALRAFGAKLALTVVSLDETRADVNQGQAGLRIGRQGFLNCLWRIDMPRLWVSRWL